MLKNVPIWKKNKQSHSPFSYHPHFLFSFIIMLLKRIYGNFLFFLYFLPTRCFVTLCKLAFTLTSTEASEDFSAVKSFSTVWTSSFSLNPPSPPGPVTLLSWCSYLSHPLFDCPLPCDPLSRTGIHRGPLTAYKIWYLPGSPALHVACPACSLHSHGTQVPLGSSKTPSSYYLRADSLYLRPSSPPHIPAFHWLFPTWLSGLNPLSFPQSPPPTPPLRSTFLPIPTKLNPFPHSSFSEIIYFFQIIYLVPNDRLQGMCFFP